jgi:hypothetical protein
MGDQNLVLERRGATLLVRLDRPHEWPTALRHDHGLGGGGADVTPRRCRSDVAADPLGQ